MGWGCTTCQDASSPVYVKPAASQPVPAETNFATLSNPAPLSLTRSSYVTRSVRMPRARASSRMRSIFANSFSRYLWEIKSRAPHAIDATCFRSRVCAMAWRFHAIDATSSP